MLVTHVFFFIDGTDKITISFLPFIPLKNFIDILHVVKKKRNHKMRCLLLAAKTAGLANRRTDILANRISQLFAIFFIFFLKLLFFPKVSAMGNVPKSCTFL